MPKGRRDDYTLFFERHRPILNQIETNASNDGCMFETYGKEEELVRQQPAERIFTLIEAEGRCYACPGFHWVNRQGYFIVDIPWTSKTEDRNYKIW